jgi:hypothetical protein
MLDNGFLRFVGLLWIFGVLLLSRNVMALIALLKFIVIIRVSKGIAVQTVITVTSEMSIMNISVTRVRSVALLSSRSY